MPMAKSGEDAQSPGEPRADEIEEDEEPQGNQRDGADVSRVTDYVEEKELDQSRAAEVRVVESERRE